MSDGEIEAVPKQIVARFRAVAVERIERIEAAWQALTQRTEGPQTEAELFQDVHTLKGDAKVVGFADVVLVSQRLEDVLFAARRRRFRVHEDVDIAVTMGFQFVRMLVRKKAGTSQGGIDLGGLLKLIDDVMAEWPRTTDAPMMTGNLRAARSQESIRIPAVVRQRLATVASNVYVEYLASPPGSRSRKRLFRAWEELSNQLASLDTVALEPLVKRHAIAVNELAAELHKEVNVLVDVAPMNVGVEVLDALNAALVHTLRNAIDHGIERPEVREAAGKDRRGLIQISVTADENAIELTVTDDGAGVDLERVRLAAMEGGHMSTTDAKAANDAELLELLFLPGFSLRDAVGPISGRGVGMDAVHSAVNAVRGRTHVASQPGEGVTVVVHLPQASHAIEVHRIPSSRAGITFAVPSSWRVRPATDSAGAIDPLEALGIACESTDRTALRIERDRDTFVVWAGGEGAITSASRICPSAPGEILEVVQLEGGLAILLRPETFFPQAVLDGYLSETGGAS